MVDDVVSIRDFLNKILGLSSCRCGLKLTPFTTLSWNIPVDKRLLIFFTGVLNGVDGISARLDVGVHRSEVEQGLVSNVPFLGTAEDNMEVSSTIDMGFLSNEEPLEVTDSVLKELGKVLFVESIRLRVGEEEVASVDAESHWLSGVVNIAYTAGGLGDTPNI